MKGHHINVSDDEYEEKEVMIFADFQSKIPVESLTDPNLTIKLIGIETSEPIMQINSKIFQGSYECSLGTDVFFTENPNPPAADPLYETAPEKCYQYLTQTNKVLKMNRIFIEAKDETNTDSVGAASTLQNEQLDNEQPLKITKSYSDALNQFLKPGEQPPRSLDEADSAFFQRYCDGDTIMTDIAKLKILNDSEHSKRPND